jgi:hypothetical protein
MSKAPFKAVVPEADRAQADKVREWLRFELKDPSSAVRGMRNEGNFTLIGELVAEECDVYVDHIEYEVPEWVFEVVYEIMENE